MKIIQSFWSKPYLNSKTGHDLRSNGGWLEQKYFLYSVTLSCLRALKHYENVELYTDKFGKVMLIDILNLPYTKVFDELNCIDDYPVDLWALGKVYSYSRQSDPFLHIDNDVFVWDKFSNAIEAAPLVAQNIEYNHQYYHKILKEIKGAFDLAPLFKFAKSNYLTSSNLGIFGGTNTDFLVHFSKVAFDFVKKNIPNFKKIKNLGLLNVAFEQLLFHELAQQEKIPIHYLYGKTEPTYADLMKFHVTPSKSFYIHTFGSRAKWDIEINLKIDSVLRVEYPKYYYRINSILKEFFL